MSLAEALKLGMRRLASGVSVISAKAGEQAFAMTASSVTSLSDSPASLLVCINKEAALQQYMEKGFPFSVSILSAEQAHISNLCAQRDAGDERFSLEDWSYLDGLPYLSTAQATFFCTVDNDRNSNIYGTHQVVIGKLDHVIVPESETNPLIYVDGGYHSTKAI